MIREGVDIQVVDARTGEDLTRVVLTQIILEDAKEQPTGLPLELLRELIMASDRAGRSSTVVSEVRLRRVPSRCRNPYRAA